VPVACRGAWHDGLKRGKSPATLNVQGDEKLALSVVRNSPIDAKQLVYDRACRDWHSKSATGPSMRSRSPRCRLERREPRLLFRNLSGVGEELRMWLLFYSRAVNRSLA
jgi:hypothetical protein